MGKSEEDEIPWFSAMTTFFGYSVLILFGQMRDFFGSLTGASRYNKVPEPVSCLPECHRFFCLLVFASTEQQHAL